MSMSTSTGVASANNSRQVSAFFDTHGAAETASQDLIAAGIPRERISLTAGQGAGSTVTDAAPVEDKGFWESLKELFLPDEDRSTYAEGLRRGGYLLTVRTDDAHYDRVLDILDRDGSVNMDEREASWRSEGWTGFDGGVGAGRDAALSSGAPLAAPTSSMGTSTGLAGAGLAGDTTIGTGVAGAAAGAVRKVETALGVASSASGATRTTALDTGRDEVIPVYEESLRVGKRDVNHGRVRVRSYVVETPVNEQVTLREETVRVDRRPVDRPVGAGEALFQDRVIEAEEHEEQAVVAKEARIKEEITLQKTAEQRTETVTDSVRRTEVEVEDNRTAGVSGGVARFSAATDSARIVAHMQVVASDGTVIGTVDHLDDDGIKLAKTSSPDGQHHHVPLAWVDHVDTHVHLNKAAAVAKAGW